MKCNHKTREGGDCPWEGLMEIDGISYCTAHYWVVWKRKKER
jgi:hypothetical protein